MKRKILSVFLAALLLLSLCACGEKANTEFDLDKTAAYLVSNTPSPVTGSMGGEWLVFGLARYGYQVPEGYFDAYYANLEEYVIACGGALSDRKYTEFSRVIIAVTAIGKDARNVAGYDLTQPLANYERTVFQGINGAVYALIALDCGDYEIPQTAEGTQATRDMYVDYILSQELSGGGWSFAGGTAEVDMTAMVLQALAKYTHREDVQNAVDRGLSFISEAQLSNGGFGDDLTENCETLAQVIVAFTQLGVDVEDSRFVKSGNSVLDRLGAFMIGEGGFVHALDEEKTNPMATEQAFYALVSVNLQTNGTKLF